MNNIFEEIIEDYEKETERKVNPEEGGGWLTWKVEVALVALKRKPVALTHYDGAEPGIWDDRLFIHATASGVNTIVVPRWSVLNARGIICDKEREQSTAKKGWVTKKLSKPIIIPTSNQIGLLIWFREDNRPKAVLLAEHYLSKLTPEKVPIFPPDLTDSIQGLILGYNDAAIIRWNTGRTVTEKEAEVFLSRAKTWIGDQLKRYEQANYTGKESQKNYLS